MNYDDFTRPVGEVSIINQAENWNRRRIDGPEKKLAGKGCAKNRAQALANPTGVRY